MELEIQRLRSLERPLREVLGEDNARTLMDHLPREEIATKSDLRALEFATKSDLRSLEAALRADMRALEDALRADMGALEERFDFKMESLEHRLLAAFRSELSHQTRTFFVGMVGSTATVGALAVTAAKLG